MEGAHEEIPLWKVCGACLNEVGTGGYTPMHLVSFDALNCFKGKIALAGNYVQT